MASRLADRSAAILANHGIVTLGNSPDKALHNAELVERTAMIVWGAHAPRQPGPAAGQDQPEHGRRLQDVPREPGHVTPSFKCWFLHGRSSVHGAQPTLAQDGGLGIAEGARFLEPVVQGDGPGVAEDERVLDGAPDAPC